MPASSKGQNPVPNSSSRSTSRVEYRLADDGGTLFRTFVDARPGRNGERRPYAIEGHLRKMTPELESEIAELLAQALLASYRRRENADVLDQSAPVETPMPAPHTSYVADLTDRLWEYRHARFAGKDGLFDPKYAAFPKPPVFGKDHTDWNVIATKGDPVKASAVRALIPTNKRHRWFRSMKSSQALALSVFGNLKVFGHTDVLTTVQSDGNGGPAFGQGPIVPDDVILEHEARLPGERTSTSIDVLIAGATTVCIECKLSEAEIGPCSRPQLPPERVGHCDGANPVRGTGLKCPLADRGVKYWDTIPQFVQIEKWKTHSGCPLLVPYQLVRNVLAANPSASKNGHALLVYDARNPAFWPSRGGVFEALQGDLHDGSLLRRCSWQGILAAMNTREELQGLVREIELKYGLTPWR
jgi:hypothetical protein